MGYQISKTKLFFRRIEGFFSFFKQQYILHHLIAKSGGKEIISKYKNQTCDSCENIDATSPIWVCWWQGKENMPDIVKACYNSIQKHACNHPVILITEENFRNYIDMPEYIINKQKEGYIDIYCCPIKSIAYKKSCSAIVYSMAESCFVILSPCQKIDS